ncbi:MAG: DUF2334 domain-containing protein [Candidatus Micrarchaeota archaeon]
MLEFLYEMMPGVSQKIKILMLLVGFIFLLLILKKQYKIKITNTKKDIKILIIAFVIIQLLLIGTLFQIDSETKAAITKKIVIIEIHDFWNLHNNSFKNYGYSIDRFEYILSIIEKYNYSATLGVSPYIFIEDEQKILALRDDKELVDYLISKKGEGHEIAMHGYAHCRNQEYCPSFEENYLNIFQGKNELDTTFNQKTFTYLPPGNFWDASQYENVKKNGFKVIGNTNAPNPYWDEDVLITPRGYDVVESWDWYSRIFTHTDYTEWIEKYENSELFILQLHSNTFDGTDLEQLESFMKYLYENNATVVTHQEAYLTME